MADYNNEEKAKKENLGQFAEKAIEKVEKAEKIKKWVTRIIAASKVIGIGIVIGGILALTTFLASALDYLDWDTYTKAISVKANAIGEETLEKNILVIEDGKYKISYDGKTGKEAIEAILEDNNMNFEDFTDEEIECLYKALKAEWATTYPNLGEDVDNEDVDSEYVQGVITIKRGNYTNPEGKKLTYKPYEEFSGIKDATALDYFSIKDGNIIVAGWSTNQVIFEPSESMPEDIKSQYVSTEEQISIQEVSINYRSIIGIHTMPFDFLAALLVNTEDVDFVDELADLAFNSTIEATIYDNTTQITTIETEHINEETTYQKWVDYYTTNTTETFLADGTRSRGSSSNSSNTTYNEEITSTEKKEIDYTLTTTRITKNNSYTFGLTNVSSWIADITNEYTYSPKDGEKENLALGGPNTSNYEGEIQEISVEDSDVVAFKDSKYSTSSTVDSYNNSTITQTITCTITAARKQETSNRTVEMLENSSTTDEYKYEKGPVETENIGEKFKEVYDNNSKARAQLEVVSSWLFELLEESSSTIDYVSVMKYLLYVCTGENYGVTEDDIMNTINLFQEIDALTINQGNGTGWWWPIGSEETEVIDGKVFAKGEPALGKDRISRAGLPTSKYQGYYGTHQKGSGAAVDIAGLGQTNKWNIISIGNGTVVGAADGIADGVKEDGRGGAGNYVKIDYGNGIVAFYYHLYSGSITVKTGDTVEYGQVIGKMGNSGNSTGVHLHIEIKINGNIVDTTEYINPDSPRTTGSSLRDWLWEIEGGSIYINGATWIVFDPAGEGDNTMNLAHGMVIADYNGGPSWYPKIIPGNITVGQTVTETQANQVWELKIKSFSDAIDSACVKYNVTLNANQRDALISCIYRLGYGKNQHNDIVKAYKDGGNAGLWGYMKDTYNRSPEYEKGTKNRVAEEYELFVTGDYTYQSTGYTKYNQYCNNPNI